MGVPDQTKQAVRRAFATFTCPNCQLMYDAIIPALFLDLPQCARCGAETQIHRVLDYSWMERGRWDDAA